MFYEARVKQLADVYSDIDADNSGGITADEIRKALEKLDLVASDEDIRRFMKRVDQDGSGDISFEASNCLKHGR